MADEHRAHIFITALQLDNPARNRATTVKYFRPFVFSRDGVYRYRARQRTKCWSDCVDDLVDTTLHHKVCSRLKKNTGFLKNFLFYLFWWHSHTPRRVFVDCLTLPYDDLPVLQLQYAVDKAIYHRVVRTN